MLTIKKYKLIPFNGFPPDWYVGGAAVPLEYQVERYKDCGPLHPGAKDLGFPTIQYGAPIHAIEKGTVRYLRRNSTHCTDDAYCPDFDNMVLIEGNDHGYTGYHHVKPLSDLQEGMFVEAGQKIGHIDDSGVTSGPHLHLARYTAGELATWWHSDRGTCDWGLAGWDAPDLDPGEDPYN
ncbi:peptidoglycan DD-metalloendopeptidase family protein [Bacillus thuringiensis]|nr:peptidoglycan DD-metalloendopeptidase family protein [Bacillus thuringiensis]